MTFFGNLPKIKNFMASWNYLNTGRYGAGNFKTLLLRFLARLCATAQQSYCPHAGVRRPSSSFRRSLDIVFSDTTEWITVNAKFGGQVPMHHISRSFFFCFVFLFFKILNFWLFTNFLTFLFSLTWDHMAEKILNDISSESTHHIHSQKNHPYF